MDFLLLLSELRKRGVELRREGNELKVKAAEGILNASLIASIKEHKDTILERLQMAEKEKAVFPVAAAADNYPVSFGQKGIWLLSQHPDASRAYNIPLSIRLGPAVVLPVLEQALQDMVTRHEALRTAFIRDENGTLRQQICQVKLSVKYKHIQDETLKTVMYEESMELFDLSKAPLIKATIIQDTEQSYLLLNIHHIIFDGFSGGIFQQELMNIYQSKLANRPSSLPQPGNTFKDFAAWEHTAIHDRQLLKEENFWKEQLSGEWPLLQLRQSVRPVVRTNGGDRIVLHLEDALRIQLGAYCAGERVSLYAALLSALNVLFYRYTGHSDLLTGTVVTGREHVSMQSVIGLFVNSLPVRTKLSPEDSMEKAVEKQHRLLEEVYVHQQLPFSYMVEMMDIKYNSSHAAVFDILVVFNDRRKTGVSEVSSDFIFMEDDLRTTSQFDLSFSFSVTDDSLDLSVEFNTDIYDAAFISRFGVHYENLLRAFVNFPGVNISTVDYLSVAEKKELLEVFNNTVVPVEQGHTLVSLFREQVQLHGSHPVLYFRDRSFSFAEIDVLSSQLSHYLLAEYDLLPEELVAVCLQRSEWLIISLLAVLKAGCAYVPVDPSHPAERINYVIADSGSRIVLDKEEIERFELVQSSYPVTAPEMLQQDSSLAYVIYTSGSTGRPKGCMVEHRSVLNRLAWGAKHYAYTLSDKLLQKTNFTFDVSVFEIFTPLCFGSSLVLCEDEDVYSPERIGRLIASHQITLAHFVPGMLQSFINTDMGGGADLRSLRRVFCSGESLPLSTVTAWYKQVAIPLSNLYGPTEASVEVSYYDIPFDTGLITIGGPVSNTQLYVLDDSQQLLPVGISGELYIGGVQVARGYHNQPELTAARFIPDEFKGSGRLYKTGDRVRWLSDGSIEYIGRMDNQVKLRGYRIEPGEIEHVLTEQPGITAAIVVVHNDMLLGYVEGTCDELLLKKSLQQRLPDYMVPVRIIQVESFPLTGSGKVDRRALPLPDSIIASAYVAPRTSLETGLSVLWKELLKKDDVISVESDFFELGGHSLRLMQLINQYEKLYHVKVSMPLLFRHTTIASHAKLLTGSAAGEYTPILPVGISPDYAVSDGQRRIWILSQLKDASVSYHLFGHLELSGEYDAGLFEEAVLRIIARHESLRTVFRENPDSELRQVILPADQQQFHLHTGFAKDLATAKLSLQESIEQPFDLANGPLLRVSLLKLGTGGSLCGFNMHHIISDGWSMQILQQEVFAVYNALKEGKPAVLKPLAIQYKDYAAWQQLQPMKLSANWWKEQFAGELPVLELPGNSGRPSVKTYHGYVLLYRINAVNTGRLQAYCHKQGSTLFMGLLAVLNTLLYRYSGQEDIIIGSPVAGRNHSELEGQIGFYINTLALRNHLKGEDSFSALLENIKRLTLEAYEHQAYPFDKLVEDLPLKRDTSRAVLFDVMMILHNQQENNEGSRLEAGKVYDGGACTAKFDHTFYFTPTADGLDMGVEYNTDIYDKAHMSSMLMHFDSLLQSVLNSPEESISKADYLLQEEKEQLLFTFNNTAFDYPHDTTVIDLFREQVSARPEASAVIFEGNSYTYQQLEKHSNALAGWLQQQGVSSEVQVPVYLPRSADLVVAILAILKAGGTYLPVDPEYPLQRVQYMLNDAAASVIITNRELANQLDGPARYKIITTDHIPDASLIDIRVKSDQLAYVIYTSGSTGNPKGVQIPHSNLVNFIHGMDHLLELTQDDHLLAITSISFDISILELLWTLSRGMKITIRSSSMSLNNFDQYTSVTALQITPSYLGVLLEDTGSHVFLSNLQHLIVGGEKFPEDLLSRVRNYTSAKVYNVYGPTETTIWSSGIKLETGRVTAGKPIVNTGIYILDKNQQLCPVGISGELYIGGAGVARGYSNNEALTAARFITLAQTGRIYATGDLARWLPDGTIEILGRNDHQVKVRGYRIETGEIESVINTYEEVRQCVVVAVKDETGNNLLAGYLSVRKNYREEVLYNLLKQRLPDYMLPSYFIEVADLPLTPNGKIDRNALPAPGSIRNAVYIAPANEQEERVSHIWQSLLKQERVSVTDDFFSLGGHSLRLMQLTNHYNREFGIRLSMEDLFRYTTIRDHAVLIAGKNSAVSEGIPVLPVQQDYVVSDGQRRLWILAQQEELGGAYHLPGSIEFNEALSIPALENAIAGVINRHEILRTVFRENEQGELRQVILSADKMPFNLEYIHLEDTDEQEISRYIAEVSCRPFDLRHGPLFRAGLIRKSNDNYQLWFNMHHIISDGWSMEVLLKDVQQLYMAETKGNGLILPPLSIQYKDYAAWQQAQLNMPQAAAHRLYWQQQLQGDLPVLELPATNPRPLLQTQNGKGLAMFIPGSSVSPLQELCNAHNATLFMGLLGVLKTLIYRYTGQEDIIIGSPVAGREHAALEDQIGFYINTLVLRTRIIPAAGFTDLLTNIRATTLAAYEHQGYPFDRLVEGLELKRDTARSPLFDVMMTMQNQQDNSDAADVPAREEIFATGMIHVKYDMLFNIQQIGKGIRLDLRYNADIYSETDARKILQHLRRLIDIVVDSPAAPLWKLDYLSAAEHTHLTRGININRHVYNRDKHIIILFKEQAARTPEKTAVIAAGETISYAELEARSNQLANYLLATGTSREEPVIVIARKSVSLVINILGILKAGAAFVPVDPGTPEDRLQYIIADTNARFITGDMEGIRAIQPQDWAHMSPSAPSVTIRPDQAAYVMYTSGSTGKPKGVVIAHYSLTDHLLDIIPRTGLDECHSFAILASLAADAYYTIFFASLLQGGELHLPAEEILFNGVLLKEYLGENRIDGIKIFPSLWQSYAGEDIVILPHKVLIFGGEAFSNHLLKRIRESGYKGRLFNHYGPTESTIGVLLHQVDIDRPYIQVPVGRPYSNTQVYITDRYLRLCAEGVAGELLIGGDGVALGYLNNPLLTAEKFIPDPFTPGAIVYRTGDLVRRNTEGEILYIGRTDDQVKVRGYRIEPGEIEHVLLKQAGITGGVVTVFKDATGQNSLAAYYTGEALTSAVLRTGMSAELPEYMLPAWFIHLDHLPLMKNGKTDRRALPAPDGILSPVQVHYTAPRNEVEQAVLESCQHVIKRELPGGMTDSFFESGGDSIKAILLATQLKKRGYTVKVGDILKYPVLEVLCRFVTGTVQPVAAIQETIEGKVLLTPVQTSFFENNYADKHHYNQSVLLESSSPLNSGIIEKCLQYLTAHHDALRMVFTEENVGWQQYNRNNNEKAYHLEEHDLRKHPEVEKEMREICDEVQSSFNLARGPLFKAVLFHFSENDCLLLVAHHLVTDGVSWRIIIEDLSLLYAQLENQQPVKLPAKTDSFLKWAAGLYQVSNTLFSEISYWESMAANPLPQDADLPATNPVSLSFSLSKEQTTSLVNEAGKVYNTDVKDLLLLALGMSLKDVFKINSVLLEMEGHGREEIIPECNVSRTVGWFTSMYPFVLTIPGENITDNLVQLKETLRNIPNKGIGYGMLRYLQQSLKLSRLPDITFNYLGTFDTASDKEVFSLSGRYRGLETSGSYLQRHKLMISSVIAEGTLLCSVSFSGAQYKPATIQKLLQGMEGHLSTMISRLAVEKNTWVTPADLSFKGISIGELKSLNPTGQTEDIYEQSPLQEGIYYHWLSSPASASYVNQVSYQVSGRLDINVIKKSYDYLCNRHAILRTSFTHRYAEKNLQIVKRKAGNEAKHILMPADVEEEVFIRSCKESDIQQGFDLHTDSLMRLSIVETGKDQYVFIWTYHHILMDGWCSGVLISELYVIYRSILAGGSPMLHPVFPYVNYINWLVRLDAGISKTYWNRYLEGYENTARVPFKQFIKQERPRMQRFPFMISNDIMVKVRRICSTLDITENTFIQGCWAWLLSKYNNTQDVVFGAVVSGRPGELEGVETMIGLFINTIPVRAHYTDQDTIGSFLKRIHGDAVDTLPHHYLPLAEAQAESILRNELFDHIFVYENFPVQEIISSGLSGGEGLESLTLVSSDVYVESNYDFTVQVAPVGNEVRITFMYRDTAFSAAAIAEMHAHLMNVITGFAEDEQVPLSDVRFLSAVEQQLLLQCTSAVAYPVQETIISLFEKQASLTPDAPALAFEGHILTYRELNDAANRLGHYLVSKGVQPGSLVPLCADRSVEAVTGLLGIMKAGAGYVPVDPSYPKERISYILSDIGADIVVTLSGSADKITTGSKVLLDNDAELIAACSSANTVVVNTGNNPLYVIYTSGSTGTPKGVLISHTNMVDYVYGIQQKLPLSDCKQLALVSGISTDLGNTVLYTSLLQGSCLHLFSMDMVNNGNALTGYFNRYEIDCLKIVPSHWKALSSGDQLLLPARLLIFGGETLHTDVVRKVRATGSTCTIVNHYGPTETTVGKLLHIVTDADDYGDIIPVGRPFSNTQIYILDKQQQLCAAGTTGELYIGGIGVSAGYLHNPELTALRFVVNPFADDMLYKTGDAVKYLEDGNIVFLGRTDNQVKVRGYRVELEEIENVLQNAPGVTQGAVVIVEDAAGDKQLVGYITGTANRQDVAAYLQERLPVHMQPSQLLQLPVLPLTVNGKINRRELAILDITGMQEQVVYVAPRNETEIMLADLWQEVLGLQNPVSVKADFFDLGGHSIKVIKLLSRISKAFGIVLSIQTIFKEATIEHLAHEIENIRWLNQQQQPSDKPKEKIKI
ncbi:amino acid adenylation domain-containing protein [Chitinophaga oryziterrae]|uniref:Amino acid adenylation domain-containing protein n=1 Tax=Chitinophaga oryziterrae TaxID=1031224 RepID=A0A6N8JAJ1_9BACT|nr:non-ribosomal peptide synthetase [Chitinophaga oryziterrae]MVT42250.1 amino acid adenylation domain-containing protein [Chitinophaga oryziterrae]